MIPKIYISYLSDLKNRDGSSSMDVKFNAFLNNHIINIGYEGWSVLVFSSILSASFYRYFSVSFELIYLEPSNMLNAV